jgi:Tfp pilus assembly protein PilF
VLTSHIESTIFYRHTQEEVQRLSSAIIPLAEHIGAVAHRDERSKLKAILGCEYFRVRDARTMRTLLLRAAKHARAHLDDYFPMMRTEIMTSVEQLEEATEAYYRAFVFAQREAIPTN